MNFMTEPEVKKVNHAITIFIQRYPYADGSHGTVNVFFEA